MTSSYQRSPLFASIPHAGQWVWQWQCQWQCPRHRLLQPPALLQRLRLVLLLLSPPPLLRLLRLMRLMLPVLDLARHP